MTVLSARAIALSAEQRQALDACHDAPTLARWIAQAVSAASAEEALTRQNVPLQMPRP